MQRGWTACLGLSALVVLLLPGVASAQEARSERVDRLGWSTLLEGPPAETVSVRGPLPFELGAWRTLGEGSVVLTERDPGPTAAFASEAGRLVVALWVPAGSPSGSLPFSVSGQTALELAANGNALIRAVSGDVVLVRPGAVVLGEAGPEALSASWAAAETGFRLVLGSRDETLAVVVRFEAYFSPEATRPLDRNGDGRVDVAELVSIVPHAGPIGAATVDATKTDALQTDSDGDTRADPGDTLRYTVTVGVTGATVPGATFDDTLDANTTLVPGSTNVSPLALDDSYETLGNVRLTIGSGLTGLFANDREFLADTFVLVSPAPGEAVATTEGGSVTVAADGSFVYDPPAGFRGPTDTFSYVVQDGRGLTGAATVTIGISGVAWFVDSEATVPGDGTLAAPFQTLAEAAAADADGDTVYLLNRSGSAPPYAGGFIMEPGERLAGQGVPLVVGSATIVSATSAPLVMNAAGSAITLAANVTVEGLQVTAANDFAVSGSGDLETATLRSLTLVTSDAGGGLRLTNHEGTLTSEASVSGAGSGPALVVDGGAGTVMVTDAALSKTGGRLVEVRNKTGGAVVFTGGNLALTGGVGDAIVLASNSGGTAVTFGAGLSVVTVGGRGLVANGTGVVTVGGTASTIAATGGAALDATATVLDASFASLASTTSSGTGIRLDTVAGTLHVGATSVISPLMQGILVQGSSLDAHFATVASTTVTGTGLERIHVTGSTGAVTFGAAVLSGGTTGVSVSNSPGGSRHFASLIVDDTTVAGVALTNGGAFTVSGTASITPSTGAGLSVTSSAAAVAFGPTVVGLTAAGSGVTLTTNSTAPSFSSLSVTTAAGPALAVTSSGLKNPAGALSAAGGPAVDASGATFDSTFASTSSTNSTSRGLSLTNSLGTLVLGTGAVTGSANAAVFVSGGSAIVNYAGSVTQTTGAQRVLDVSGTTGGSVTFSGTLTGAHTSTGVSIANALGNVSLGTLALGTSSARMTNQAVTIIGGTGTYSLGNITIYTTAQPGLVVTNADGTLNVASGLVETSSARAIDIDGPPGLTTLGMSLVRVSATGGTYGIRLQDTNGTFSIAGDGGTSNNGSGGIITAMAGANGTPGSETPAGNGIFLRNATNVSLSRMNLTSNQNNGIFAEDVSGLTLLRCVLNGNGDDPAALEGGLRFTRLAGTNTVTDTEIRNSPGSNVYGDPTSGTFTLTFTRGTVGPSTGGSGINIVGRGSTQMTLDVNGVSLADNYVDGVQTSFVDTSTQTVNVTGSTCLRNLRCVDLGTDGPAALNFDISGNSATGQVWQPFVVGAGIASTGSVQGFIRNNTVGTGAVDSGSVEQQGIFVDQRGQVQGIVSVTGNGVRNTDIEGIKVRSLLDAPGPGRLDLTLRSNVVGTPDDNSAVPYGTLFGVVAEARNTTNLCLDIAGNDAGSLGTGAGFRVRQLESATFRLERFVGDGTNATTVAGFVAAQNMAGSTAAATVGTGFTGVPGGTCLKP